MNDHDIQTATLVLAKCAANDPWFPNGGEATVLAWAEAFAESGLSREDLLAGVARAYRESPDGFKPLAASIVRHARAAYFEQLREIPDDRRALMDEANYALQDMGISPPEAHRYARRVALGRKPHLQLTAEQDAELRQRLAKFQNEIKPQRPMAAILNFTKDANA